jgi:hypothetical protein
MRRSPSDPSFAAAAEEYRRLLAALEDDVLRSVAVWKMEGHTSAEVAGKLAVSVPSLRRGRGRCIPAYGPCPGGRWRR